MLLAEQLEERKSPFGRPIERFRGYGVLGSPFLSGHFLSFRRTTSSSLGSPFTSIWHRDPKGYWTMVVDTDPALSCPRYFGEAMDRILVKDIGLAWEGPNRLSLEIPELGLEWGLRFSSDVVTRALGWVGSVFPGAFWRVPWMRSMVSGVGGRALGVGHLSFSGRAPEGQKFFLVPKALFRVEATVAVVGGEDLGPMGPLSEQVRIGDLWLPNGGLFGIGEAGFRVPAGKTRPTHR
jgi:hypothetical protein